MLNGIAGRIDRTRTAVARATLMPLLLRGGIGLAFFAATLVAWPASLVVSRYVVLLAVVAVYPAFAPRGRGVTVVALAFVGGWVLDTTWYDARVALWRVLAVATLLYAGHSLAALAAVLPYDAIVNLDVVTAWLTSASGRPVSSGMPARCTTPSSGWASNAANTASASAQSPVCQAPSKPSGSGTRSRPTTSWPRSTRPGQTTRPIVPAAPVTRILMRMPP